MNRPLSPYLDARFVIHTLLTAVMAAMAVQLFLPGDTYGAGTNTGVPAGNWRMLAGLMLEKTAAATLWMIACVGFVGLVVEDRRTRLGSVLILAMAHAVLAGTFMWSNPAGVGAILLSGYALLGLYLAYRRTAEGF